MLNNVRPKMTFWSPAFRYSVKSGCVNEKHSSLFRSEPHRAKQSVDKRVSRGQCYKTFYGRKLQIFVISWSVCPWQALPALSNVCG
jgi:hypothetical protein